MAVDGSALPGVTKETVPLQLVTQSHHEDIIFDVVEMANHHIVLGMPWLRQHNPTIDWKSRVLRFKECDCVVDSQPTHRQRSMVDERKGHTKARKALVAITSAKASSNKHDTGSAGIDLGGQTSHEARVSEGSHVPSVIPEQYSKWKRLFQDEENANALPRHQPWDHEIRLEPGKQPTFGPIYALSEKELKTLREYLDENLARGFIRKSESPAGYPILFAPKKDGSLRLCVDYRKINDITIKNRYPLPNIEELQDRLSKAKWFSKIDLKGAYNLIRMKEGEEWKTAFRTRYGHYEYLVMPFGLTNAPATCQMMINDTLREYLDITVVAYLDDILIYTDGNLEQHVKDVQQVLTKLQERRLKANPKKCEFHVKETEFLGFIIGVDGIRIDPAKITSIKEWPTPKNLKEVQSFLGLANYNRKFISGYSQTALPLVELTKQDTPFIWKERQQKAFDALKQACIDGPTLRMFDSGKPVHIETDASDRAIGACLTQDHEGKRHPVAYYSRKMTPAEQNYDIHDKELLAIVAALQHWRVYAEGAPSLTILTDHKNLLTFTTTKVLNRRQVRWSELLGQYKFKIQYTPGKDNGRADALSRRIDYMEGKEAIIHSILQTNKDGTLSARTHEFNAVLRIMKDDEEQFPIFHDKYQVPERHQEQCIKDHHDDPTQGHPGITKTIENIQRNFAFPQMKAKVTAYVQKCRSCQMNKSSRHAKYGEIQFVDPPLQPWDEVTMDFITGLRSLSSPDDSNLRQQSDTTEESRSLKQNSNLKLRHQPYDSILVMVDRLTKYTHFVPCMKSITAEELAHLVLDRLIRYHGIPKSFITDRDKLFTSNYWKTLVSVMGIKHKLSTAYHPQTDGQTERANQTLEAYLRHYVNYAQDNWVIYLPMAQLALNQQISATTGVTPFYANFGKHPNLFMEPKLQHPNADKALITSDQLKELHKRLRQRILSSQDGLRKSRQKSKPDPQLKKGDKVYLLTKNLRSQRTTKKLDHVKVGPFLISEVRGPVNYKLQLPDDAKIHPVFHISLLEPADPETPLQTTFHFQTEEEDEFEVERILEQRGQRYLVKWKGYPHSENTWEPKNNLRNCRKLLQQFQQIRHSRNRKTSRNHRQ
jgi:transposase InsO family protein